MNTILGAAYLTRELRTHHPSRLPPAPRNHFGSLPFRKDQPLSRPSYFTLTVMCIHGWMQH